MISLSQLRLSPKRKSKMDIALKKQILQNLSFLVIFRVALRQKYAFVQKSAKSLFCYGYKHPKKTNVNHQTPKHLEAS